MTKLALVVTTVCLIALSGCGGLDTNERALFEKAVAASEAENWSGATHFLDQLLELNSHLGKASLLRGRARVELAEFESALVDLDDASASGDLSGSQQVEALVLKGRCHIGFGEALFAIDTGEGTSTDVKARQDGRSAFVRANGHLGRAVRADERNYDASLWRAYCYYRLQNYPKSIEILRACEAISPGRWEHRFFKALAVEGIYNTNAESTTIFFEIAEGEHGKALATLPLYEHLIALYPELSERQQERAFTVVDQYARETGTPSELVAAFLDGASTERQRASRALGVREALFEAEQLVTRERFGDAVKLLQNRLDDEGDAAEVTRQLRRVKEIWSRHLEARAMTQSSQSNEQVEAAAALLRQAIQLTVDVDRLATLQKKLADTTRSLTRRATSATLQKSQALLADGRDVDVLAALEAADPEALSGEDRDLFHYLRGVASFRLERWRSSAHAFAEVKSGRFEDLPALHGLALTRSGNAAGGAHLLLSTAKSTRDDTVRRVLAKHFAGRSDHERAAAEWSELREPTRADHEQHVASRHALGKALVSENKFAAALPHLKAARDILEKQLGRSAADVQLLLGNSYFHAGNHSLARKAYDELARRPLSLRERQRVRDLYLNRARIHLSKRRSKRAYRDLADFKRLGGQIDGSLERRFARLLATYGDFLPLDRVHFWKYVDAASGKSFRLVVRPDTPSKFKVERHDDQTVSVETWVRDGLWIVKTIGKDTWRIPVALDANHDAFPESEYIRKEGKVTYRYKTEIQSYGETVALAGGKKKTDCIKVRLWRKKSEPAKNKTSFLAYVVYFAPDVGEVKREVKLNNVKVSEVILSGHALREENIGN